MQVPCHIRWETERESNQGEAADSVAVEFQREDAFVEDEEDEPDQPERPAGAYPEETEINWLEGAEAILRDVTLDKMGAYEWLNQGMPRVQR